MTKVRFKPGYKRAGLFMMLLYVILAFMVPACSNRYNYNPDYDKNRKLADKEAFVANTYQLFYRVESLPEPVREMLKKQVGMIANPGEPYNSTDLVHPGLPMCRLYLAGVSRDFGFVAYRRGGFVPRQQLLLFNLSPEQVSGVRRISISCVTDDLYTLKHYIKTASCSKP